MLRYSGKLASVTPQKPSFYPVVSWVRPPLWRERARGHDTDLLTSTTTRPRPRPRPWIRHRPRRQCRICTAPSQQGRQFRTQLSCRHNQEPFRYPIARRSSVRSTVFSHPHVGKSRASKGPGSRPKAVPWEVLSVQGCFLCELQKMVYEVLASMSSLRR